MKDIEKPKLNGYTNPADIETYNEGRAHGIGAVLGHLDAFIEGMNCRMEKQPSEGTTFAALLLQANTLKGVLDEMSGFALYKEDVSFATHVKKSLDEHYKLHRERDKTPSIEDILQQIFGPGDSSSSPADTTSPKPDHPTTETHEPSKNTSSGDTPQSCDSPAETSPDTAETSGSFSTAN